MSLAGSTVLIDEKVPESPEMPGSRLIQYTREYHRETWGEAAGYTDSTDFALQYLKYRDYNLPNPEKPGFYGARVKGWFAASIPDRYDPKAFIQTLKADDGKERAMESRFYAKHENFLSELDSKPLTLSPPAIHVVTGTKTDPQVIDSYRELPRRKQPVFVTKRSCGQIEWDKMAPKPEPDGVKEISYRFGKQSITVKASDLKKMQKEQYVPRPTRRSSRLNPSLTLVEPSLDSRRGLVDDMPTREELELYRPIKPFEV